MATGSLAAKLRTWRRNPMGFVDTLLRRPDGTSYGKGLDPWQREDLERALTTACHVWWERPRGHSKTQDAAAVALTRLVLGGHGQRIYFAAVDQDQSALAFDSLRGFVLRNELLAGWVRLLQRQAVVEATDSTLTVLAADAASSWGLRPVLVVLDELEAWRGDQATEFFYSLVSSLGKVKGARLLVCSTAGWDRTSLCWKLREQVRDDPAWIFVRRGQCASWVSPDFLEQQRRILPEHVFRMLHLNEWTEAGGAFLTHDEVADIFDEAMKVRETAADSAPHFIGLDVGLSHDATAVVVVHREKELVVVDAIQGWRGKPRDRVDLGAVEEWIRGAARRFSQAEVVADPWQAVGMLQRLAASGVRTRDVSFTQQYRDRIFSNLLQLVREKRLRCFPHETLKEELLQLSFTEKGGALRVDHRPGGHDDHAAALAMAALAAVEAGAEAPLVAPLGVGREGSYWRAADGYIDWKELFTSRREG